MATGLLLTACSSQPEQPILQQFFTASRLRDNQTLANFAAVSLDPTTQGSVMSFSITNVTPEQSQPLLLKDLSAKLAAAKAADDAFTKKKLAYQNDHMEAIERVLKAEAGNGKVEKRDEQVKTDWDQWRKETEDSTKKVSDAQQALTDASGVAQLSINGARPNPIDINQFNGQVLSKDVTVSANLTKPNGGGTAKTNIVVTMKKATFTGADGKPIEGRWVITNVKVG
ncbi:MAG: hypothetical protein KGN76_18590 [Acidobacteriota bacterium]|nr:hypothetical protein [Acidobacteriota bacterium]